jgi:acetyl esterase
MRYGSTKTSKIYGHISRHRAKIASYRAITLPANTSYNNISITIDNNVLPITTYLYTSTIKLTYPTIFYIPGTAFIAHETSFSHVFCSHLAKKTGYQIIKLCHRLAPKNPFPAANQDIYNLFNYCAIHYPEKFNIDKKNIIISGYSSGGTLATLLSLRITKTILKRQILISPMLDLSRTDKGFNSFEDLDKFPNHRNFVDWMLELYLPKTISPKNSIVSPYWSSARELNKLPTTDILFGEYDLVRGDCEGFKKKLESSSVDASRSFMFKGCDHCLMWQRPLDIVDIICGNIK